jgi:hypothetical protein
MERHHKNSADLPPHRNCARIRQIIADTAVPSAAKNLDPN